jgi:hypothetical protein
MKNLFILLLISVSFHMTLEAQCFPDRHNTSWYDGWVSCEASDNPNPERGQSHWLMYDFGYVYKMGQMHVWNTNDVEYLDWGLRTVVIDYSLDGLVWTELGTFDFDQATGKSTYEGFEGPDFDGIEAQYVLITAIDNFGGSCYGLSEIKIRVDGTSLVSTQEPEVMPGCLTVHMYPNPFVTRTQLKITTRCEDDVYYGIRDALGKVVIPEQKLSGNTVNLEFSDRNMAAGVYFLSVRQGTMVKQQRLVKIGN